MSDKKNDISNDEEIPFYGQLMVTPFHLLHDKKLKRIDSDVFGVVSSMCADRRQVCTATNSFIGRAVAANPRTVGESIERLERNGYIQCVYLDGKKKRQITRFYSSIEIEG